MVEEYIVTFQGKTSTLIKGELMGITVIYNTTFRFSSLVYGLCANLCPSIRVAW